MAAEALEAAGRYREAAELTAQAMTHAHAGYVQSKVRGVTLVHDELAALPRIGGAAVRRPVGPAAAQRSWRWPS